MARTASRRVHAGGVYYDVDMEIDESLLEGGKRAQAEFDEVVNAFVTSVDLARTELRDGLLRGGVSPAEANTHPREYMARVLDYLNTRVSKRKIPIWLQSTWDMLMKWEPEPDRFFTWFSTHWVRPATWFGRQDPRLPTAEEREYFRHTVIGTVLGLLGNEQHRFRLNTGGTDTMGSVSLIEQWWPRSRFRGDSMSIGAYGRDLPDSPSLAPDLFWAEPPRLRRGLDYWPDPIAVEPLSLLYYHRPAFRNSLTIRLKRPSKVAVRAASWQAREASLRQTILHEASHAYGHTADYFYLIRRPGEAIKTSISGACAWFFKRNFPDDVTLPKTTVQGEVMPQLAQELTDKYLIATANADSVAAYLHGFASTRDFPEMAESYK